MEVIISLARHCPRCKRWAITEVDRCIVKSLDQLESMPLGNVPISNIECCGLSEAPTHLVISDSSKKEPHFVPLGTAEIPLAGKTHTQEEIERIDRGAEIQLSLWREQRGQILNDYYEWVKREGFLHKVIDEFMKKEMQAALDKMGVLKSGKQLSRSEAVHVIRRMNSEGQRQVFCIISEVMIEDIIFAMYQTEWPVEQWRNTYGKHRIIWPVVHMPIVDDLEGLRISAIAKLGGTKRPETAILFERIRSLEDNLRRRAEQVRNQNDLLVELRAKQAGTEEKLSLAYAEIRRLKTENVELLQACKIEPDRRVREFKGLIAEMRQELRRLQPKEEVVAVTLDETTPTESVVSCVQQFDLSDKVIGIIGGLRQEQAENFANVITATGDEDPAFVRILTSSDILVVLTQHVSHSSMWAAKEYAIENEKLIVYSRHINLPLILMEVSNMLATIN
jgi:Protein involved in chromosome segregation, interacts with SMC proteins